MTRYYVSPSGNDANNGTAIGTPKKTAAVLALAFAGDTIEFATGTYQAGDWTLPRSGAGSGSISTSPITLEPAAGATCIIPGVCYIKSKSDIVIGRSDGNGYIQWQGGLYGIRIEGSATGAGGCSRITLYDPHTYDTSDSGISVWGTPWQTNPNNLNWAGVSWLRVFRPVIRKANDGGSNENFSIAQGVVDTYIENGLGYNVGGDTPSYANGGEGFDIKAGARRIWVKGYEIKLVSKINFRLDGAVVNVGGAVYSPWAQLQTQTFELEDILLEDCYSHDFSSGGFGAQYDFETEGTAGYNRVGWKRCRAIGGDHIGFVIYSHPSRYCWGVKMPNGIDRAPMRGARLISIQDCISTGNPDGAFKADWPATRTDSGSGSCNTGVTYSTGGIPTIDARRNSAAVSGSYTPVTFSTYDGAQPTWFAGGSVVVPPPLPSAHGMPGVGIEFDGATNVRKAGPLDNTAASKVLTLSFWVKSATNASAQRVLDLGGGRFTVDMQANGDLLIVGKNAASTTILSATVTAANIQAENGGSHGITSDVWTHVLVGVDMADTANRYVWIQGAAVSVTWTTYTDDTISLASSSAITVGSNASNATYVLGALADIWLNDTFLFEGSGTLQKFNASGTPVDLGIDGSYPLGNGIKSLICLSGHESNWALNDGEGGGFLVNAGTTTSMTRVAGPTDPPPPVIISGSPNDEGFFMTWRTFDSHVLAQQTGGAIDFDSDTIKVALITASVAPLQGTHDTWSDLSANEVTGTNYSAGGITLANKAVAFDGSAPAFTCDNPKWTHHATGFSGARYAVMYSGTALIAFKDLGGLKSNVGSTSASDFELQMGIVFKWPRAQPL